MVVPEHPENGGLEESRNTSTQPDTEYDPELLTHALDEFRTNLKTAVEKFFATMLPLTNHIAENLRDAQEKTAERSSTHGSGRDT